MAGRIINTNKKNHPVGRGKPPRYKIMGTPYRSQHEGDLFDPPMGQYPDSKVVKPGKTSLSKGKGVSETTPGAN